MWRTPALVYTPRTAELMAQMVAPESERREQPAVNHLLS